MIRKLLHELEVFVIRQRPASAWAEEEMACTVECIAVESDLAAVNI
jgi:hypothetical protein